MTRPIIGIPYAEADIDERGYFVTCPDCQKRFYSKGTSEDDVTKGATSMYGRHYQEQHVDKP